MNILYIVHDNKKGGAALSFLEMLSLIREEHNVYVLTPHKKGFVPQKLDEMGIRHDSAHYFWWKIALPSNRFVAMVRVIGYKMLNIWNFVEAKRNSKKILDMQIDIIHSNSSVINFGALLSKETKIPHVWHLREYGEEDFNLKCVVSARQYKKIMNDYAETYIAISKSIKNKFSNIVDEDKIVHIYNGVSEKFCLDKDFNCRNGENVKFLISGNYCKEKGQDDVIRAVIELRKQGIDGFKLYLAGNGDFLESKRLVEEHKLKEYVSFCGCVDDMARLRTNVDVEIVASKCEAFGRVTIEAMRMSNPVIGTNTGGTPELIKDNCSGFLFEYQNSIELANCMKRFISNKNLIKEMGQRAYTDTKSAYTPTDNAFKILEQYKRIKKKI